MGWLLGFRKQKYNFVDDYVNKDDVFDKCGEGFVAKQPVIHLELHIFM